MDWKKLHNDITGFANKHQIQLKESDLSYGSGTVTTYQLKEKDNIFYELKHSKPIAEYGSKLSIYSNSTGELSIQVKTRLIGKPAIKTNFELSETLLELLSQLGKRIGSFKWTTGQHHLGWPSDLRNSTTLTFECKQIDLAVAELEPIRKIHLNLLEKYSV
ncbi:hypothetical protein [Ekhidna sp.]|uniref:hypothetical protein n=1 Tax=Ekhidna sp. TaxID=2608089 RepID=UPI003512779D